MKGIGASQAVNVDHSYLKHMIEQAMRRDLVTRNVASLVTAPKLKNERSRVLDPDEWTRLYGAARAWFLPVLLTGYHTGMMFHRYRTIMAETVDIAMACLNTLIIRHENAARHVPWKSLHSRVVGAEGGI